MQLQGRGTPVRSLSPKEDASAAAFIRTNLPLAEIPGTGGLRLHLAAPNSGLSRLVPPGGTPYWAHAWPGGVALAKHIAAHAQDLSRRFVLDIGTGSGLVALAALRAGADGVAAFDADPLALVAARLNAEANGLPAPALNVGPPADLRDLLAPSRSQMPPAVLAGDVFYDEPTARRVTTILDTVADRALILIGDIGRRFLPRDRLTPLASYPVRDVGDPPSAPPREGTVFRWRPA